MCVCGCIYLRGWTQDLRVIVGDTSSYLRGDDTSKLVTPSEACWGRDKWVTNRTNSSCLLSYIFVCRLRLLCAMVKEKCWVHETICCSPLWHHPDLPTSVQCTAQLFYLTERERKQTILWNDTYINEWTDTTNAMYCTYQHRESLS